MRRVVRSVAEKKYKDFVIQPTSNVLNGEFVYPLTSSSLVPNEWRFFTLTSNMIYGTGLSQRIGNKIFLKYIQITLWFDYIGDGGGSSVMNNNIQRNGMVCRYMVVRDKSCTNGQPPGAGLLTVSAPIDSTDPRQLFAMRNVNNLGKYKILLDRQMKSSVTSVTGTDANTHMATTGTQVIQHYIPINKTIKYQSDGVFDTSVNTAPLCGTDIILGVVGSLSACCSLQARVRLCYLDI